MKTFQQERPKGTIGVKKEIQKTLILAFEANSALSRENETKIVKITHSETVVVIVNCHPLRMANLFQPLFKKDPP